MPRKPPASAPPKERDDTRRHRAAVQKALVAFIKKEKRPPSLAELVAATGFSLKTVRAHRQRITLGDGSPNVYQQLTNDVMMALYERAVGHKHPAVKIFNDKHAGIVEAAYTERYPPDPTAAKLWVQLVEGFTEKREQKYSGEVALAMKFNYVAPAPPETETGPADAGS